MTEALDKGCVDGTILGQDTTSLVGFWGVTPVAQTSALTAATTALTISVSASASLSTTIYFSIGCSNFGFAELDESQTVMKAIQTLQTRQAEAETALVNCGLIAGGTAIDVDDLKDYDVVGTGGGDDGMILGAATTDKVGFWGMAPHAQVSVFTAPVTVTTQPMIVVTITASQIAAGTGVGIWIATSDTGYGFKTVNNGQSFLQLVAILETRMAEISARMVSLGIITGATAKTSATKYDYLDKNNDDGSLFGRDATAKVGFYGTTPVVQPSALTTAAVTIVASIYTSATDVVVQALASTTASFYLQGITATQILLDTVQRLQIRMGEMETVFETVGLMEDDSVSGS